MLVGRLGGAAHAALAALGPHSADNLNRESTFKSTAVLVLAMGEKK